jgi:hypothetical protein
VNAVHLARSEPTDDLDRLLEQARHVEDLQVLAPALVLAARGAATSGDSGRAMALLKEFDEATADRASMYRSALSPSVARLMIEAGDIELARGLVERSTVVTMRDGVFVDTAAAAVREAEGEPDAETWRELEARWHAYGSPFEEALAALALGRAGDDQAATERGRSGLRMLGVPT